jgi:ABC-type Fe3+-hydroxamate transport system substrate-binding protein
MLNTLLLYGTFFVSIVIASYSFSNSNTVPAFAQAPSSINSSTATIPTASTNFTNTTEATAVANQSLLQQSSSNSSTTIQPRVIGHDMGETTITGTPQRIVAMGHVPIEVLFELGMEPVGASGWEKGSDRDPEAIWWEQYYTNISENWPNVVNVGGVNEPNFEVISSLEADLIVYESRGAEFYDELSEIAPTLHHSLSPPGDMTPLEHMELWTMQIADALNRHDEGVAMIERMNANFEEESTKLEAADLKGERFVFLQVLALDNLDIYAPESRQSDTLESIGLLPALPETAEVAGFVVKDDGSIAVGLEQMAALDAQDVHVIYLPYGEDQVPMLKVNPVWGQLSYVLEGRLYSIGASPNEPIINIWGGPLSTMLFVDKVVEVMTNSSSSSGNTN